MLRFDYCRCLLPGEGDDLLCALTKDDHQDGNQAVAGMKRLLVGDLLDNGGRNSLWHRSLRHSDESARGLLRRPGEQSEARRRPITHCVTVCTWLCMSLSLDE